MIKNKKFLGRYRNPHTQRVNQVYVGTDGTTGNTVRFIEKAQKLVRIPYSEWVNKWRKAD